MKLKHLFLGFIALIGLTYFTTQDASAQTIDPNSDEFISQVKIYDENGDQIPYTTEELKDIIKFTSNDSSSTVFQNIAPRSMKTTYDDGSGGVTSNTPANSIELPGGWSGTVHMSSWSELTRVKSYRFKLTTSSSLAKVDNIQVWYNWQG